MAFFLSARWALIAYPKFFRLKNHAEIKNLHRSFSSFRRKAESFWLREKLQNYADEVGLIKAESLWLREKLQNYADEVGLVKASRSPPKFFVFILCRAKDKVLSSDRKENLKAQLEQLSQSIKISTEVFRLSAGKLSHSDSEKNFKLTPTKSA